MYIILIIAIVIVLIMNYYIFNRELLCPPVAILGLFLVCSLFGLLEYNRLNYSEFGVEATLMILLGLLSFTAFSCAAFCLETRSPQKYSSGSQTIVQIPRKRIEVNPLYSYSLLLFCMCTVAIYYMYIVKGTERFDFSSAVQQYRLMKIVGIEIVPALVRGLLIVVEAVGTIALFCLVYNRCFDKFRKTDVILLFLVGIQIALQLIKSSRANILLMIGSAIYLAYFFSGLNGRNLRKINHKFVLFGIIFFVAMLVCWIALTMLLGRFKSIDDFNVMDYLAAYVSNGIRNFDLFLKDPSKAEKTAGQETFYGVYRTLYLFFGKEFINRHLEFRNINGINVGNVYTAFRRYYKDLGVSGIIILSGIEGLIFTRGYFKNKKNTRKGDTSFAILLYAYLVGYLFFMPIDDMFFSNLTLGLLLRIVMLYILFEFLVNGKISIAIPNRRLCLLRDFRFMIGKKMIGRS